MGILCSHIPASLAHSRSVTRGRMSYKTCSSRRTYYRKGQGCPYDNSIPDTACGSRVDVPVASGVGHWWMWCMVRRTGNQWAGTWMPTTRSILRLPSFALPQLTWMVKHSQPQISARRGPSFDERTWNTGYVISRSARCSSLLRLTKLFIRTNTNGSPILVIKTIRG